MARKRAQAKKQNNKPTEQKEKPTEKRIKQQDSNNEEISVQLQEAKDILKSVHNNLNQDLNKPQQNLFDDIQNVIQEVNTKLQLIKEQNSTQNFQNLLDQGELNENQFMDQFIKTLTTKVVKHNEDQDLQKSREQKWSTIEYTSPIFPKGTKLIQKVDYEYTSYDGFKGQSKIFMKNSKVKEQILFNFHIAKFLRLDPEIKKPTYDKNFIHIQNLNNFIEKTLNITSETQKNINIAKLFDKFTEFLREEQENHCGFEYDEGYLRFWDDDV